jgi:ComF family protein
VQAILPKQSCFLCGRYHKNAICSHCESALEHHTHRCTSCGIPLQHTTLQYCLACLQQPKKFHNTFVIYSYTGWVKILIHQFKYQQKLAIGVFFANKITQRIATLTSQHHYDVIIPMPLHNKRLRNRGFHQVLELLRQVKTIPIDVGSCVRTKATQELNTLTLQERNVEIKNAFAVIKPMEYRNILIVDDIMTTGSSTTELSTTILKHYKKHIIPAPRIDVLVLARV